MAEQLVSGSDIPTGTPEEIENFATTELLENHADELAEFLTFLGESFVENDDGDLAIGIPAYDGAGDIDSSDLATKVNDRDGQDREAVVIVNGELQRCTE